MGPAFGRSTFNAVVHLLIDPILSIQLVFSPVTEAMNSIPLPKRCRETKPLALTSSTAQSKGRRAESSLLRVVIS